MARSQTVTTLPSDYNLKLGPVLMNVNGSMGAEYNSNVGLSSSGAQSDFILSPQVGVVAQWQATSVNTLRLSTSIGYNKYLIHPQYDTGQILIAPDSVLGFDLYVGDFKINFHDQFSYQQDPGTIGSLSNVVNFQRFENVAGIGVIWDLNKLVLTLNYDHINFISSNLQVLNGSDLSDPGNLNYNADQVSISGTYAFTTTLSAGLEGAASIRQYSNSGVEDDAISVGPFVRFEVTPNFKVSASGGYQAVSTGSGDLTAAQVNTVGLVNPALGAGTTNSYYVNLTLDHRMNQYYTDRFSVGHETQLDVFSQQSEVTYVTYTSSWKVNQNLNLAFTVNYQDVTSPSNSLISTPSYNLFGAGVQANFPVTRSISGSVLYQFNDKFDTPAGQDYVQNRVGLILNYHF